MKEYYSLVSYQIQRQIFVAACSTNITLASSFTRNERELFSEGKERVFQKCMQMNYKHIQLYFRNKKPQGSRAAVVFSDYFNAWNLCKALTCLP